MMLTHSPPAARAPKRRAAWISAALMAIITTSAQAFWPFTATQENPFAGRSFITDWEGSYDTGTRLDVYVFDTDTAVTIDTLNLYFSHGVAYNQHGEQMIRKGRHSTPYEVDYKKRKSASPATESMFTRLMAG